MFEVKKKYVYPVNNFKKHPGMIRLDMYLPMIYFNYETNKAYQDFLISVPDLSVFITECLVELLTTDTSINPKTFEPSLKDIYISSYPDGDEIKKVIILKLNNKCFVITEIKNNEKSHISSKDFTKDQLLSLVFSCHQLFLSLFETEIRRCKNVKNVHIVEREHEDNENDRENKFDINDYEKI